MHVSSYAAMSGFAHETQVQMPRKGAILDVGCMDINGSYRPLWPGWDYVGVDTDAGQNVDVVVPATPVWDLGRRFTVIIAGQVHEHCDDPFALTETMAKHLVPGGTMCIIAPARWPMHRHPKDCWRFLPDGLSLLVERAGCAVIRTWYDEITADYADSGIVARKL